MFNTGLDCYKDATVESFTTDVGIRLRRVCLNKIWRKILKLCTKRKIILEQYPTLVKDEVYVFCCNHSFDEDVILALASFDRNVYMFQGTTEQMLHNPIFLALWLKKNIVVC